LIYKARSIQKNKVGGTDFQPRKIPGFDKIMSLLKTSQLRAEK